MSELKTNKKSVKTDENGEVIKRKYSYHISHPGVKIAPTYKKVYDEKRKKKVVKIVDHFDLDEFIQSSASSVDLAILKKRALEMGESAGAFVGDIDETLFPESIHDVYKFNNTLAEKFNGLDDGLKKQFGSVEKYRKAILDGSAMSIAQKYFVKEAQAKAAEAAKKPEEGDKE